MSKYHMDYILPEPRDFTLEETAILNKMLSIDLLEKEVIVKQLETAKVTGYCTCGCKTITINIDQRMPKYALTVRVPVEMVINGKDGVPIQYLLHIINGYVSELEILSVDSEPINEGVNLDEAIITTI